MSLWNFELFTIRMRCILCVKFFAHPKSILFMLMAAWCLYKISTYFCFSSCGTFKFAFCSISACEKCFFYTLGNFSSMFEMIDATVFLSRGRHGSASNSNKPSISFLGITMSLGSQLSIMSLHFV